MGNAPRAHFKIFTWTMEFEKLFLLPLSKIFHGGMRKSAVVRGGDAH